MAQVDRDGPGQEQHRAGRAGGNDMSGAINLNTSAATSTSSSISSFSHSTPFPSPQIPLVHVDPAAIEWMLEGVMRNGETKCHGESDIEEKGKEEEEEEEEELYEEDDEYEEEE